MRRDVADDDRLSVLPDFMAERRFDFELAAGLQAELDRVPHPTGDPPIIGHPRDRSETHACGIAYDVENRRHRGNLFDRVDIDLEIMRHPAI
jgi:hypothetical protein